MDPLTLLTGRRRAPNRRRLLGQERPSRWSRSRLARGLRAGGERLVNFKQHADSHHAGQQKRPAGAQFEPNRREPADPFVEPFGGSGRVLSPGVESLPCRRSWVRVPSSALKVPAQRRFCCLANERHPVSSAFSCLNMRLSGSRTLTESGNRALVHADLTIEHRAQPSELLSAAQMVACRLHGRKNV